MTSRPLILGLLIVLTMSVAAPGSALLAPYRPDAQMTTPGGDVVGTGMYGTGQNARDSIRAGQRKDYAYYAVNNGTLADTLTVGGCGSTRYVRVRYAIAGPGDVTAQIAAGAYAIGPLPSNSSVTVDVRFKATNRANRGMRLTCAFSVTSLGDGLVDQVKMIFRVR